MLTYLVAIQVAAVVTGSPEWRFEQSQEFCAAELPLSGAGARVKVSKWKDFPDHVIFELSNPVWGLRKGESKMVLL